MHFPAEYEEKMKLLLNEEYEKYIQCFDKDRFYGLRVNTNKISVKEFLKRSPWKLTPIPWIENGFYYDGESEQPAKHPYYFAGLFYLQEPSAMTPANRLPVEPGERVLDVCAAPGGKATELGAKLSREGVLVANDISSSRAKGLLKNLELSGVGNVLVLSEEPGKLEEYFPEYFDKILIDAPCSGEGMFRKDRKMIKAWEEHGPGYFAKIQKSIIIQAAQMLRPGGMLLYSTCTFDVRENEQTILHLLNTFPEFEICEMKTYDGFRAGFSDLRVSDPAEQSGREEELQKTVRIFPHCMDGEGHYLALLRKGNAASPSASSQNGGENSPDSTAVSVRHGGKSAPNPRKTVKISEELERFLREITFTFHAKRLEFRGERVYYMPDNLPNLKGVRFLRTGLLLGELKKGRFEPSQALAMFLKKEEYSQVLNFELSDERVIKYLKGETLGVSDLLPADQKGWYLVCVDGYPLGWGKVANSTVKNKYLPGWRWQS